MFKRTALYGLAVALFLICASSGALAKQFSLLLHYENGTVSTIENGLKILGGSTGVASRPEPAANKRIYRCDLIDARGVVLKSVYAKIPRTLYGDWLDENGNMAGSATVMDRADFLVNIPYADNAALIKITSSPSGAKLPGDVRLEEGSTEELTISTGSFAVVHSKSGSRVDSASIEALNSITFIVLAEGYTDEAKFNSDVLRIFGQEGTANDGVFFNYSFFGTNKGRFNVKKAFILSAQTGADHAGGCDDPSLVDTYFDASFCWDGETSRLLAANEGKALAAATEAYPSFNSDRDIIFVMVNSTTYGGSGGGIATFSLHEASTEIALHEAGHVLGGLADEYTTPYPGYPEGDPEPNVTYSLSRSTSGICTPSGTSVYISCFAKRYWNGLIAADTPLPTTGDYCIDCIGKFEGARYKTTGIYRPKYTCKMRSLNQPFCEVCDKALEMNVFGYIAVSSPAGGDDWVINTPKTIQWSSWGFTGNVTIKLVKPKDCGEELLDIPGGTNTGNDGSHPWTVPEDVLANYKIRISSVYDPSISGDSQPFDIVAPTTTTTSIATTTTTSIRPTTSTTSVRPTTTTTSIRPTTSTTSIRPTTTTTSVRPTTSTTTTINQAPLWDSVFYTQYVDEYVFLNYYIPTATDPEGNTPVSYSCVQKPSDAVFYPLLRQFQWRPSYDAVPAGTSIKNFTITVRATDSLGNYRDANFTVYVYNVNRAPGVLVGMTWNTLINPLLLNVGETVQLTATGSDLDTGDTLQYYWERGTSSTMAGTKTWTQIRGWSTTSGCSYPVPTSGVWIQFRCTVKDKSGATATAYTLINYVYP